MSHYFRKLVQVQVRDHRHIRYVDEPHLQIESGAEMGDDAQGRIGTIATLSLSTVTDCADLWLYTTRTTPIRTSTMSMTVRTEVKVCPETIMHL